MKRRLKLLKCAIWLIHGLLFILFIPIVIMRYIGVCAEWIWDITLDRVAEKNWNYYSKKKSEYANQAAWK